MSFGLYEVSLHCSGLDVYLENLLQAGDESRKEVEVAFGSGFRKWGQLVVSVLHIQQKWVSIGNLIYLREGKSSGWILFTSPNQDFWFDFYVLWSFGKIAESCLKTLHREVEEQTAK